MKRAWITDLLTAAILSVMCGAIVAWSGGPPWAILMTFLIIYFTRPMPYQDRKQ